MSRPVKSPDMYRLAQPRARWYQLREHPLVGSECVCPKCNSFVITRGSAMPSAMDLSVCISRSQELTRSANSKNGTPAKCTLTFYVKCPMMRPQRCSIFQKPLSGYQPQVGSDRVALIHIAVRTLGNDQVQQIVVSFTIT